MRDLHPLTKEELLLEQQKRIDHLYYLDQKNFDPRHRELYKKLNANICKIEAEIEKKRLRGECT